MQSNHTQTQQLPLFKLLALSTAAFLTLLTEIMPAGLLSSIATGLAVSESLAGQFITAFALGAFLAAIPATTLTRGLNRKPLLLFVISGFAIVNAVTAFSESYAVSITARFFAGVFGGILWSMLAGYASRMAPPESTGRAIAIVSAGATTALVLGVPIGSFLGSLFGWQGAFGLISVLAILLIAWIALFSPDYPGETIENRRSITQVLTGHGMRPTILLIIIYIISHSILYVYIEPFLAVSAMAYWLKEALFIFGIGAALGLLLSAVLIDRHLKILGPTKILFFAIATLLLGLWSETQLILALAVLMWGISFGGFSAIVQTIMARLSPIAMDISQAMATTSWNMAVATGGLIGGWILSHGGASYFPWIMINLLIVSLLIFLFGVNRALHLTR